MTWFYLALLAPLIYAIVNLIDDNLLRTVYRSPHAGTIVSGVFGGLPLLSLFFFDVQAITFKNAALATLVGFLTVVFYYFYFSALEKESPSVVVALLGTSPVLVALPAFFLLGERLQGMQIVGLVIVFIASLALSRSKDEKLRFTPSLLPVIAAAVVISLYSLIIKYVYQTADFYTAYMFVAFGMFLGGIYYWLTLYHAKADKTLKLLRKNFRRYFLLFLVTELLGISAELTMNLALSKGPLTPIRVIENIQPVYVLLIALFLYPVRPKLFREAGEGQVRRKLFLILLCVIGLALVGEASL